MKYKKQSIMILSGVIGLVCVAGAFMTFLLSGIRGKMTQSANETLLNSTRIIESGLDNELRTDKQLLETCADLFSKSKGFREPEDVLADFASSTEFYRFYFLDMDGVGVDSGGMPVDQRDLPFQEVALTQEKHGYSDAYIGSSGRLQITFQIPLYLKNEQIGALYADKTLTRYSGSALFTFSGGAGRAYVVHGDTGDWIMEGTGTGADDLYGFLESHGNGPEIQQALESLLKEGKAGTIGIQFNSEQSCLCFLPMESPYNWYLISVLPENLLQQETSKIMQMIEITLTVLLVALVLITTLLLSRQSMKNQEKERAYREQLFRTISANVDFVFLLYSPDKQKMELVSDNVGLLFDLDPVQVAEHPELLAEQCGISPDDRGWQAFLEGRLEENYRKEYPIGADNELKRWMEVHLIPVETGQYLAVLHETTGEHHMREDLADALRQSQESNRARTAFFSSMSHDIRTPMNGIIGMTAIAQANLENPVKVGDCLDKIGVASDHLLSLINEVLDMSRIESGKMSLKKEAVNLPELISSVLILIKSDLTKKDHMLHVKSAVLDYDIVMGDMLHLQKILLNLLSNAVKYTPEGGDIYLRVQEKTLDDGEIEVVFQVEDNGIGMSREFLDRIFTPFERAENNCVSKIAGTGLGMTITKNIVDMMGGTIRVESELGKGSCFTVSLPLPLSSGPEGEEADLTGRSVLVVDDDPDICEGIRVMLEEIGVRVSGVLSGQEAVEAVKQAHTAGEDYFAVIMDWKMPEMDGIEAARRIRADAGGEVSIILLSAYDWEEVEQEAQEAGIDGFLTKPVFRGELIRKLCRYLAGREAADAFPGRMQAAPADAHLDGLRVLLAEDNDLNREIAEELLQSSGIQVESVENGMLAVQRIKQHEAGYYGILFMDVHMPVMDGYTAAENIRRIPEKGEIPIIAMTAATFAEDIRKCKAAGMNDHISKPIDFNKVFEVIRRYWKKEEGAKRYEK
jgi:two-component system sensor histidine kinase/response regulator